MGEADTEQAPAHPARYRLPMIYHPPNAVMSADTSAAFSSAVALIQIAPIHMPAISAQRRPHVHKSATCFASRFIRRSSLVTRSEI